MSSMVPLDDPHRIQGPQKPSLDFGIFNFPAPVIISFIMGRMIWAYDFENDFNPPTTS